ncbi:MAG TPA: right-handed parallel beta-helix repeat-containing protein [bacterium]|nr:right-handed parallel beta-helix repeat-containing protein [bacterium]
MPFLFLCVIFFLGCAEHAAPLTDADETTDTATDDPLIPDEAACDLGLTPPAAPMPPAPVDWGLCPDGWEAAEDAGHHYCLPLVAADCPAGTLPVVGEADCVQLCEEYEPPDGATVVDVAAGDDLQNTIDAAPDGAVIRIAAGSYAPVTLNGRNLTLIGACPGETALDGITIEGGAVTMTGITVRDAVGWGVMVAGEGSLTATRLHIVGNDEDASGGIFLDGAATATLHDSSIENALHVGIRLCTAEVAGCAATLTANRLLVRGVTSDATVDRGKGIEFNDGAQGELTEALVENCTYGGISANGPESGTGVTLTADLLVVRGTRSSPNSGKWGYGIAAIDRTALTLNRTLVDGNRAFGIAAMGIEGTQLGTATLTDVIISDTQAQVADGYPARGLDLDYALTAELERVAVLRSTNVGVMLMGPLSGEPSLTVTGRDITVAGTVEDPFGLIDGHGIVLLNETDVTLDRILIENNRTFGLLVSVYEEGDYTTRLTATDLTVRGTRPQALDESAGIGIGIYRHAEVSFARVLVEHNRTAGVLVYGAEESVCDTMLTAKDLTVRDTAGQAADGEHGIGIALQYGVVATMERVQVEDNRMYGIMAFGKNSCGGPMLALAEALVADTLPRDCLLRPEDCPFAPGVPIAHGLGVYADATVTVERVQFSGNANGLDLSDATVYSVDSCDELCAAFVTNSVAVNAWDLPDGYEVSASLGRVCGTDNDTMYSGDAAPIPDPLSP